MVTTPLVVEHVTMIGELASAIIVQHEGRRVVIPRALVLPGSELSKPGDHGRIVVPRDHAYDLALIHPATVRERE